jgi:uncharacterized membrane protein
MADAQSSQTGSPARAGDERLLVIVVYGLYLAAFVSCGLAGIAGVIVAYIKRDEARGTLWESHFDNQINAFWGWFILFLAGIPALIIFGLGVLIIGFAFLWLLYRTLKGLLLAIENRPFA